jgi:SPP1 gp7 family putative phage head morphogenesis protein
MAKKEIKANSRTKSNAPIVVNDITVAQLHRGNQNVQTWFSAVKAAESSLSPNRRLLYNTFLDVSIDLYLDSVMQKRIRAVKTTPFEWQDFENDVIKDNFRSPWFIELLGMIQNRIFYGTTLAEFDFGQDGLIQDVTMIPRQNVKPELGLISKNGAGLDGFRYREGIYPYYILEIGRKTDLGLLTKIAPYVLMKRANMADFMRFNEMFGMDLRVYEYDPNKPGARQEMEAQAKAYSSAAYIVLPKGYGSVTFEGTKTTGSQEAYTKAHNMLNDEITIGVLGQLLTTGGADGGSYALGNVHKAVETAINMEDRLMAEYIINYPFKNNILIPHGYPLEGITGKFKTADEISKEVKLKTWVELYKSGAPIAEEDFYKEFGIEPPGTRPVVAHSVSGAQPKPTDNPDIPPSPSGRGTGGEGANPKPDGGAGAKKLSEQLTLLYNKKCGRDKTPARVTLSYKSDLEAIVDNIINRLRTGELKAGDVDLTLYNSIAAELWRGVEKGFEIKLEAATGADKIMLQTLRDNVYRFSGFKTYHFIKEANSLLVDADNNIKAFSDFKNDVLTLNNKYNVEFLRTEYNHAIATSRMASKWSKFTADKATLPLLQFDTVGDGRVRIAHQKLDGIIKPVDDPFWDIYLPPLSWNCRCTVRQLAAGEITNTDGKELTVVNDEFKYNWGKEQFIFPPDHPQFTIDAGDQPNADKNFGLPLPG